jgi:hypothetical protein
MELLGEGRGFPCSPHLGVVGFAPQKYISAQIGRSRIFNHLRILTPDSRAFFLAFSPCPPCLCGAIPDSPALHMLKSLVTSTSMQFLEGLNPQQSEAVCHTDGPLLILAGAGSGKTRVITRRIARLIGVTRVPASAIWAVTFTNKAADEMRQRVAALLGASGIRSSPWLSTFHSFCVRLLRQDAATLADLRPGFTGRFAIYDEDDQLALVKAVYRQHGLDEKFM